MDFIVLADPPCTILKPLFSAIRYAKASLAIGYLPLPCPLDPSCNGAQRPACTILGAPQNAARDDLAYSKFILDTLNTVMVGSRCRSSDL